MTQTPVVFEEWRGLTWIAYLGFAFDSILVAHGAGWCTWNSQLANDPSWQPRSPLFLAVTIFVFAASIALLIRSKSTVEITSEGLTYRFVKPITIRWHDVTRVRVGKRKPFIQIWTHNRYLKIGEFPNQEDIEEIVLARIKEFAPMAHRSLPTSCHRL